MSSHLTVAIGLFVLLVTAGPLPAQGLKDCPPPPPGFPKFKVQEIASDFKIGYAVHICDVNGDGKPDIVVVDKERVVWYENPTWKMRTILQGKTKPDNVCICSLDIDKDGKVDFVLGAGWKPFDTKTPGTLQWLRRKPNLDDEWDMFPIPCDEPMVHRIKTRWFDAGDGIITGFVMAPLMGSDSTKEKNWMDGRPVNVLEYFIPEKPTDSKQWKPLVIQNSLHVIHNFTVSSYKGMRFDYFASSEGITKSTCLQNGTIEAKLVHQGNQSTKQGSRGASELSYSGVLATIEPWHGNEVVFYIDDSEDVDKPAMRRIVIDNKLRWGHAIERCELVPQDDRLVIIAGVRDNPDPKQGDKFTEKRGVRIYRAVDAKGEKWERYILEDGGVAVEDLAVADLNGDGKPEIIAVGRATQNCRIYWNQGK